MTSSCHESRSVVDPETWGLGSKELAGAVRFDSLKRQRGRKRFRATANANRGVVRDFNVSVSLVNL